MAKKKLSTKDILAAARAEAAKKAGSAEADSSSGESQAEASAPAETEESSAKPSGAGASKPKSTKDILAAARAQAAGGSKSSEGSSAGEESGGSAQPSGAGTPKSTKDILAAARSQAKPGGTKPSSTKDILAAARAQAGGSGAEKGAAGGKSAPKAAPAEKPSGDLPSVQEMVKAVRGGAKGESAAAGTATATKPTLPPMPKRPAKPAVGSKSAKAGSPTRRGMLAALLVSPFAIAWTLFSATSLAAVLGVARYMFPNVLVEPPSNFKIGPPSDYPPGMVSTKWTPQFGVWIVNTEYNGQNLIYALSSVCTHLGCTPNWLEGEQKFKCPCHGSGFYITGINFEGPAPRPLERVGIRLADDGMLEVDKSVTFQEELGQWDDPASFVEVV